MVAFIINTMYNFMGDIMKLNCENYFCIYEENGKCILDKIELDILGQCTECIYVNLEQDVLNDAKQKLLKKYEISNT
jgi:hypothetical protein